MPVFEEKKLATIRAKLYDADLAGARVEIEKIHAFPSPVFMILKAFSECGQLMQEGEILKAQSVLFSIDENSLLLKEKALLSLSRAELYLSAENFRDSRKCLGEVGIDFLGTEKSRLKYILIRNELLLKDSKTQNAREFLEQEAEKDWFEDISVASIYHSLALLEYTHGNKSTALDLYADAWLRLKKTNCFQQQARTAGNYILCLAIENNVGEASRILGEFESLLDYQNINQLIEYLNIKSNLARQICSREMILQTYKFSEQEIEPRASDKQKLMLFATQIKSAESDGFNIAPFVEKAMMQLEKNNCPLTLQERLNTYSFLLSILIEYISPSNLAAHNHFVKVYGLYRHAVSELNLTKAPINLPALRNQKLDHNTRLMNMSLNGLAAKTYEEILGNQIELKNLRACKNDIIGGLDSMMLVLATCINYPNYENVDIEVTNKIRQIYIQTLEEADSLLEANINIPSAREYFIGLAYFNYKQPLNYKRSLFWFNHFKALNMSIHHQSLWHRDLYSELKAWLNTHQETSQ